VNVEQNKQYYSSNSSSTNSSSNNTSDSNQVLIEKLNYMINLLEEQQDQKTGSVTEEVVLYSFLGVFIIFVVDSFARVGKYVR
jgi:K+-transporting ATPase c subunit